jgi:hypothetical protein
MITATGALEKMTIVGFEDSNTTTPDKYFKVMYNPNTFSISHANSFDKAEEMTTGTAVQKFLKRTPRTLTMEIFFDGTGGSPATKHPGVKFGENVLDNEISKVPVHTQVEGFLEVAYRINSDKHRSAFLVFVWGPFIFPGVLESANLSYSLFDSTGNPLRAKISITVKEHVGADKLKFELKLASPDLTQFRIVTAGDNLPNLAKKIYGDEKLYMEVARVNNLQNYRKLVPGTELRFPPIEKIKSEA